MTKSCHSQLYLGDSSAAECSVLGMVTRVGKAVSGLVLKVRTMSPTTEFARRKLGSIEAYKEAAIAALSMLGAGIALSAFLFLI